MRISDWSSDVCSSDLFKGLLCYSAREAAWLATQGFDDLLVAYPTVVREDLEAAALATRAGTTLTLMIDDARQIDAAEQIARERSEEHTSELQSLMRISYAVFCLKKKNKHNTRR